MKRIVFFLLSVFFCLRGFSAIEYPLVPMPKEIKVTGKQLAAPKEFVLVSEPGALPARVFNQNLKNHDLPVLPVRKVPGTAKVIIRFGSGAPAPAHPQGYSVSVKKNGGKTEVLLSGHDKTGVLYAAVTFAQMFRNRQGKLEFPVTEIRDFPDVPGRYCASIKYQYRQSFLVRKDKKTGAAKRHVDWALEHKINVITGELTHHTALPETASPAVKKFFKEVNDYAAERGIISFFVTMDDVGTKQRDGRKPEFKDCIELRGKLYDWGSDELLQRRADEIVRYVVDCGYRGLMVHTMDTRNSLWGERSAATRKRFGDDRFSADANIFNIFYRTFRKAVPDGFFFAVPRPYCGNPENPEYLRKIGEVNSGDSFPRFSEMLPEDVYICKRESSPEEHEGWMHVFKQPLFTYLEHDWGTIRMRGTPLGTYFRYIPCHFKQDRKDWLFYEANWPEGYPAALAAVEFAWNLKTPGSRRLSRPPYGSGMPYDRQAMIEEYDPFGPDGKRNEELLPLIRRVAASLYGSAGPQFEVLLTSFIRPDLIWNHREVCEQLARINVPMDPESVAVWVGRVAADSKKAIAALKQIPADAPRTVRQTAGSRIASLLRLTAAAAALEQGLLGEIALRKKDYDQAEKHADTMMEIYRKALEELPVQWAALRKKPLLASLPADGLGSLKKFGGELRLRELRIKSRIRMRRKKAAAQNLRTAPEQTSAAMINAALYAPEEGAFYGAESLKKLLASCSDIRLTVINDLKLDTLLKFDCLIFPDCKRFGKVSPDADVLRAYCLKHGRGIYFEHDSCGHARFPFHTGLFPELGDFDRAVGFPMRHRSHNDADRNMICKRTGEKFKNAYSDHFTFKGVAPENILVVDKSGAPVWIAGKIDRGRVVYNGGITFHKTDRETEKNEISLVEQQLITDAIRFCAGKKGHIITLEDLRVTSETQTDAEREVVRFKVKLELAAPLKNGRISFRIRRNGKEEAALSRKLPADLTNKWESEEPYRLAVFPGREPAVLYVTVSGSGKETTRSFRLPAAKN